MKLLGRSIAIAAFATLAVGCTGNKASEGLINGNNAPQIIGGTDVVEGSDLHKSIVGIYDQERGALCTGSLLENNIVLTAAHCIGTKPENHLIIFAADLEAVFASKDRNFILSKVRRSVKTVVNPEWSKKHFGSQAWGDTALIKFVGAVPAGFQPATMLAPEVLAENTKITVAGYGVNSDILTEVKREDYPDFDAKVKAGEFFCVQPDPKEEAPATAVEAPKAGETQPPVATVETCYKETLSGAALLRTTELTVLGAYNDTEVVFDQQHGQASCEGDSGGPAYVKVGNEYHLFGVTSRGTRGCNGYVVYSDVATPKLAAWLAAAKVEVSTPVVPAAPEAPKAPAKLATSK